MKINWGTGIVIAIVAFMSFILFLVIKMSTNNDYEHDLVVKDYYKQELKFQEEIDKANNLKNLKSEFTIQTIGDNIVVNFPKELKIENIKGHFIFYRPSNEKIDFMLPIELSSHQWVFPKKNLISGRWNLSIDFRHDNNAYLYKEEIIL